MAYRFEQLFRARSSEQWSVLRDAPEDDGARSPVAGRVDVHWEDGYGRVTVVLSDEISDDDATEVLARVDEQLVPAKARADLRITLWRGKHAGTFVPVADEG